MIKLSLLGIGAVLFGIILYAQTFHVPLGWYERTDKWGMGETNVRCLCEDGFVGWPRGYRSFVILIAPRGYTDTPGRWFKQTPVNCLNCAD
jgi:hypothetical protein